MAFVPDQPTSRFVPDQTEQAQPKKTKSIADEFMDTFGPNGNLRGSTVGGFMQGMADPVAGAVQFAGNLVGAGDSVNKGIANKEAEYQQARQAAGREGFDATRMAGNVASAAFVPSPTGASGLLARTAQGFRSGAVGALAMPVNDPDNYWNEKGKQVATGAAVGGVAAPVVGALSRVVSPKASKSADLALLKAEGVTPTIGQTLGGTANTVEQKLQSVPIMGDAITAARQRTINQMNDAAANRALRPIGESVKTVGGDINAIQSRIGKEYDNVLPKMAVDVTDPAFVNKIASLRQGVSNLPKDLQDYYDAVISREIDGRIAPNGMLSGQNLKDAWIKIREQGQKLSRSQDPFQSDLGNALKQTFEELKTHVANTNPAADVANLKAADTAYANFKRLQRAASSVGADEGVVTPAQLNTAVKALDKSKDKAAFAAGNRPDATRRALMQDLSGASKRVLSTKVPDSGTAGRLMLGGGAVASAALNPAIPVALAGGAALYTPMIQRLLSASATNRPQQANRLAELLRELTPQAALAASLAATPR